VKKSREEGEEKASGREKTEQVEKIAPIDVEAT